VSHRILTHPSIRFIYLAIFFCSLASTAPTVATASPCLKIWSNPSVLKPIDAVEVLPLHPLAQFLLQHDQIQISQIDLNQNRSTKKTPKIDPVASNIKELSHFTHRLGPQYQKTVLYPFSGMDIDSAVYLFPAAEDFIFLDRAPFFDPDHVPTSNRTPTLKAASKMEPERGWDFFTKVDQNANSFQGIGYSLAERVTRQGYTIERILAFRTFANEHHGYIEFKGQSGVVKRLWFFQVNVAFPMPKINPQQTLFNHIEKSMPTLTFIKASMTTFFLDSHLKQSIQKWQEQHPSLLVEGFHNNAGEFTRQIENEKTIPIRLSYHMGVNFIFSGNPD
jgi:hypothetical protein